MTKGFHKAFTLMEVNLAILVMAGCVLSVVTLYSLGFRENKQSMEDVAAAAYADAVLGKLATALSDPNVDWDDFKQIVNTKNVNGDVTSTNPENGWGDYFDSDGDALDSGSAISKAQTVFSQTMQKIRSGSTSGIDATMPPVPTKSIGSVGLVVRLKLKGDTPLPVAQISFRASRDARSLMSSPMYFTEVAFQGKHEPKAQNQGGTP